VCVKYVYLAKADKSRSEVMKRSAGVFNTQSTPLHNKST